MDQVFKESTINGLEKSFQSFNGFFQRQGSGHRLIGSNDNGLLTQRTFQIFRRHTQQMTNRRQMDIGHIQTTRFIIVRIFHQGQVGRMQECRRDTKDGMQFLIGKLHGGTGVSQGLVGFSICHTIASIVGTRGGQFEIFGVRRFGNKVMRQLTRIHTATQEFVKNVIIPFADRLVDQSNLFQEIGFNAGSDQLSLFRKLNFNKLSKATAVVVAYRTGIAKGFQNGIGLQHLSFNRRRSGQ
mmetsp:Transcript_25593/g.53288  ORF Transcript_25593/g.53288 Transcript_25593/m.53288 type:complete len:240 (+) Transcript_25593:171-890(+)